MRSARQLDLPAPGIQTRSGLYLPRAAQPAARALCRAASALRVQMKAGQAGLTTLVSTLVGKLGVGRPAPAPRPGLAPPPGPLPSPVDPAALAAVAAGPVDWDALRAIFA
jgi:hypothetical protein